MGRVYIVHHVDTEGPLFEPREELFGRLKGIFNIDVEPREDILVRLRNKEIDLQGKEDEVALAVAPHMIDFKGSWQEIDHMLGRIMSASFRNRLLDSEGNGWVYNWHCMDHVGFKNNPRKRDLGYFKIFDFYQEKIKGPSSSRDAIHWHFHPINFAGDAHLAATSYNNSMNSLLQSITRRVLERNWFTCVNRAGFHAERPDSHLFLEQWLPFDASNQSVGAENEPKHQLDLAGGRFGDWRWAPQDWTIYHPSHDNYQLPGDCRRSIARVLNLKSRHRSISAAEIEKAFRRAAVGEDVYLGIADHDWREMSVEVDEFRDMLQNVIARHPDVQYYFSDALTAFRSILYPHLNTERNKIDFNVSIQRAQGHATLQVEITNGALFGPQPWLAITTKEGKYLTDNFDVNVPSRRYSYVFDCQTVGIEGIEAVAVASNDKYGYQKIVKLSKGKDF